MCVGTRMRQRGAAIHPCQQRSVARPQLRHLALCAPLAVVRDGVLDEDAGHARVALLGPVFAAQLIAQRLHVDVACQAGGVDRLPVMARGQLQVVPVACHLGHHQQMFGSAIVRA